MCGVEVGRASPRRTLDFIERHFERSRVPNVRGAIRWSIGAGDQASATARVLSWALASVILSFSLPVSGSLTFTSRAGLPAVPEIQRETSISPL